MNKVAAREDRVVLAILIMLGTYFLFASMDTVAKLLVTSGLSPIQVSFTRFFAHFVVVILFFLPRHGTQLFRSASPKIQMLRGLGLLGATIFNFAALAYLPLTVTIAIMFSSPLGVCLLSILVLKEKVGVRRLTGVFVGFMGVLVITQAWSANFQWAMLLSVCSMLSFSVYIVLTRKLAGVDNNMVSQIYSSALPALVLAPFAWMVWQTPATAAHWVGLFIIGVLGAIGHSLLTYAHRLAQASTLAPIVYVQIIYVTALSWIIFNSTPNFYTIIGTGIIVASGLYIWLRDRELQSG